LHLHRKGDGVEVARKGGGLAVVYKSGLQIIPVGLDLTINTHELARVRLSRSESSVTLIIICRLRWLLSSFRST